MTPDPTGLPRVHTEEVAGSNEAEQSTLAVHLLGSGSLCSGCWACWSRLAPYPCWQVDWATNRQARSMTAVLFGGRA